MSNLVTTIYSLVFTVVLADSPSVPKADTLPRLKPPQLFIDFVNSHTIITGLFLFFCLIVFVVTKVGNIIESIEYIIIFCRKFTVFHESLENPELKLLIKFRKELLKTLKTDISNRRINSLHNLIQIDLKNEEQRHQVGGIIFELVPEDADNSIIVSREFRSFKRDKHQTTPLTANQKVIEFFDREYIDGKLLILGDPGAGKTTELIRLAKDLIERAIDDETASIPIIFELSSWKKDLSIEDWLVEQLPKKYPGLPKTVAKKWLDNQQLIPLLDGLDELGLEAENKCIVAINKFLEGRSFQPGLVVCCRLEEYEQAQTQLNQLNGAVYLRPLSDDQIQQYLQNLNRSRIWNKMIINESSMLELARKPLFLTMLVVAYQGRVINNYSELFETYIEKQLNNPDNQGTYSLRKRLSPKQTLHYLVWLAKKLENERETEFLIEGINPFWLESNKQKNVYNIILAVIYGMIFGLSSGLIVGAIFELSLGLIGAMVLIGGLIGGLIFGLIEGLNPGLTYGVNSGLSRSDIENNNFANQGIWNSLNSGLFVGLNFGLFIGLFFGVIYGVIYGLIYGLIYGVIYGVIFGLIFGLIGGINSVIQHVTLRFFLYSNGYIPWNYAQFLEHAVKHRFIQRVGGRYRFMHDLLRKHFAQMPQP